MQQSPYRRRRTGGAGLLLVLAAGFASLAGLWAGSSSAGVAVRLAIVAVGCVAAARRGARRWGVSLFVAAAALSAAAVGGVTGTRVVAAVVAVGLVLAAVLARLRLRSRKRIAGRGRRPRRRGRTLIVALMLAAAAVPALAEVDVLATDGPPSSLPPAAGGSFVQTGDVATHVEQWGSSGSTLVLVHGFLESTFVWGTTAPLLAARHRVSAYDVRGFGYTERRGPFTLDGDVAQLDAFLAANNLDADHGTRPILIGHSSGAAIITAFARLHPDRVAGIVLVDGDATPYGAGPGWAHALIADPLFTAGLRAATSSDAAMRVLLHAQCGSTCATDSATLDRWSAPMRQPGAEDALLRILRRPLIGLEPAQVAETHVPAAVMSGALDSTMGAAGVARTAALLRTSLTAVLPGEHHLPMLHDPAAFVAALEPLLARLTP